MNIKNIFTKVAVNAAIGGRQETCVTLNKFSCFMFPLNALLNNEWFVDHVYFSSGNKVCNSEGEKR